MKKLYYYDFEKDNKNPEEALSACGYLVEDDRDMPLAVAFWGHQMSDYKVVTDDQDFIEKFQKFNMEGGWNPVKEYYDYKKQV